ncbi:MAG: hypothetical protein MZW92_78330 [Comamonadaceae bacterium]|nr:hypothetical protein [Comamonadaceae bacterium]
MIALSLAGGVDDAVASRTRRAVAEERRRNGSGWRFGLPVRAVQRAGAQDAAPADRG